MERDADAGGRGRSGPLPSSVGFVANSASVDGLALCKVPELERLKRGANWGSSQIDPTRHKPCGFLRPGIKSTGRPRSRVAKSDPCLDLLLSTPTSNSQRPALVAGRSCAWSPAASPTGR